MIDGWAELVQAVAMDPRVHIPLVIFFEATVDKSAWRKGAVVVHVALLRP